MYSQVAQGVDQLADVQPGYAFCRLLLDRLHTVVMLHSYDIGGWEKGVHVTTDHQTMVGFSSFLSDEQWREWKIDNIIDFKLTSAAIDKYSAGDLADCRSYEINK